MRLDLGKVLTEKFQLPNIKTKGTKRSFSKFQYDLTDKNRGFGQLLDKKSTLKKIIETNILLGNITEEQDFDPENLIINPQDEIFRILSREKEFEAQAVVYFLSETISGSMQGKPTESVVTQHLLIYSLVDVPVPEKMYRSGLFSMIQMQRKSPTFILIINRQWQVAPTFTRLMI